MFVVIELLTILLTPAILPVVTKNKITAIPIHIPPKKDSNGVKFTNSIFMIFKQTLELGLYHLLNPEHSLNL